MITLTSLSLALTLWQTPAQADTVSPAEDLARTYMDYYASVDWDAMEPFLAEDVVFSDPTVIDDSLGATGLHETSREAMMALLRSFGTEYNPIELGFDWHTVFESNGRVVFMGHVNARYPTENPDQHFLWRAEQVTVITVQNGEIIRQDDFANYAGAQQSLVPAN